MGLKPELLKLMDNAEKNSADCTGLTVNLAINYGGRDEITDVVKSLCEDAKEGRIVPENITKQDIENRLYTVNSPPLDLIIRPGGEFRVSNFLIWQLAYSELWFSDVLWPDFRPKHLDAAIRDFAGRNRRFGGV